MSLQVLLIMVSVLWVTSEILLARLKRSRSADVRCDKSSLRILWIAIALGVNCGVVLGFQQAGSFGAGSRVYPVAGLLLIACGLIVRWRAIFALKRQFTVDVSITKDHRIVREGVYRFVRHPAYAGSLASFLGLGLYFSNYISLLVIFLPICSAFLYRIHVEEKVLVEHFGNEYVAYRASTKRLIPGIY